MKNKRQEVLLCCAVLAALISDGGVLSCQADDRSGNEDRDAVIHQAQDKLKEKEEEIRKWSMEERLGIAEFLYVTKQYAKEEPAVRSSIGKVLDGSGGAITKGNEIVSARCDIINALIVSPRGEKHDKLIDKLLSADPENGLCYMLRAEIAWDKGDMSACIEYCSKAASAKLVSFRDEQCRQRMARSLKKAGLWNEAMMRHLVSLGVPEHEWVAIFHHTALLQFIPTLQEITAGSESKAARIWCRRYVSLVTVSRPMGWGVDSLLIQSKIGKGDPVVLAGKLRVPQKLQKVFGETVGGERDLIDAQYKVLRDDAQIMFRLAEKGGIKELAAFLETPENEKDDLKEFVIEFWKSAAKDRHGQE